MRLRARGDYASALRAAEDLARSLPPDSPAYKRADARRLVETLRHAASLDEKSKAQLAGADALASVIDSLLFEEQVVHAFSATLQQLRIRLTVLGQQHPETIATLHKLALVSLKSGQRQLAHEANQLVLELSKEVLGPDHPRYAAAVLLSGRLSRAIRGREASPWGRYVQAMEIVEPYKAFELPLVADIIYEMGHWRRRDDPDASIAKLKEALEIRQQYLSSPSLTIASNRCWIGWTLLHLGRHREALVYLEAAEEETHACGLDAHSLLGIVLNAQADIAAVAGDYARAEELYVEGNAILENARERFMPGFARQDPLHGYDDLAGMQVINGKAEDAWQSVQTFRKDLNLDFLHFSQWREADVTSFGSAEALRRRIAELDARKAPELLATSNADEWDAWLARLELKAALFAVEQSYLRTRQDEPIDILRLQEQLDPATAYIGLLQTRTADRMWKSEGNFDVANRIYVVRHTGPVRWVTLWHADNRADERAFISPFNRYVLLMRGAFRVPLRIANDPDLAQRGAELSRLWFEAVLPLLDGVETLVVEQSSIFPFVPLGALPTSDGDYVGDRFNIAYSPSAVSYVLLNESHQQVPAPPITALALGGCVYTPDGSTTNSALTATALGDAQFRGAVAGDAAALDSLPYLAHSGPEAQAIASVIPHSVLLTGADASERTLNRMARNDELASFDVIHIASHVLMDYHPPSCAVALSRTDIDGSPQNDGRIKTGEILLNWRLNADLVTLSGCQSALGGNADAGGRYLGFPQAFLGAGARSIVVSMWKVDDEATALLMGRFYENLTGRYEEPRAGRRGSPMPKALALGEAKKWVREYTDDNGKKIFEHPIYWAGFVLLGLPH